MKIAVLITVFNRKEKTIQCLNSLFNSVRNRDDVNLKVFLTNDGSTDGTLEAIYSLPYIDKISVLQGDGHLFWAGGMIKSWKAAVTEGGYDGYLWLNDDSEIFPNLWDELLQANQYSVENFGQEGIYVGSTINKENGNFTYGRFNYINNWTLLDKFVIPNGEFQSCQAAHGNITYVSDTVVQKEGIFYEGYKHSGVDHDYTYRAYKHGFPIFILREYVGSCENDHNEEGGQEFFDMSLSERLKFLKSPIGYNLSNTLLFQKRCFPHRYLMVLFGAYFKTLFPKLYLNIYLKLMK